MRDTLNPDGTPKLNGIDYIEVTEDQTVLVLYFVHDVPTAEGGGDVIAPENFLLAGGSRIQNLRVSDAVRISAQPNALQLTVNQWGDFSAYHLQLVTSAVDDSPPTGFAPPLDPQLSGVSFSFKVDCPNPFDCPKPADCAPPAYPQPQIDYLAKDYASFRQLMLDRLSVTLPGWTERNPADVGVALVEVLAYAADQLSYYQDAAATEAYLGTARRRASVRRHARLLNYAMHEGCNARTWIQVQTETDDLLIPQGTAFFTKVRGQPARLVAGERAYQAVLQQRPEGFEAMQSLRVYQGHNEIGFYTWSDENCCLPKGATHATLLDDEENRLYLRPGDVLLLEEARSSATGRREDADITHRQAVRLTAVFPPAGEDADGRRTAGAIARDPLTDQPIVKIRWHIEDALSFPLCLSKEIESDLLGDMGIARGNILLADHGKTADAPELIPEIVPEGVRYRPRLDTTNITYAVPFDPLTEGPARSAIQQQPSQALPSVTLKQPDGTVWQAARDLLNSDRFDEKFVVEPSQARRARLRFGDGIFGRKPAELSRFETSYRVGSGPTGNVGAEAIAHIVFPLPGITQVSNRLPGIGGTEPESIERVKFDAPQAFRVQQRAVTEADYEMISLRHPEVQQAKATRRWTGSWYTYFVTVDRKGGKPVDADFEQDFLSFLDRYRLAGYDLEINAPQFVSLDIRFSVCTQPGYFAADVEAALLKSFSNRDWPDGRRGFFHPDNFTFGQPVYLSQIVAEVMATPGVQWVDVSDSGTHRFQRWGRAANREFESGEITFDRLEIARLDNDANAPENGRIEFVMEGRP
ncbi:MAG: putative baseplate assembly protein [Cyanobacteria bacterium J06626_6]